jgi:hypothetical protein
VEAVLVQFEPIERNTLPSNGITSSQSVVPAGLLPGLVAKLVVNTLNGAIPFPSKVPRPDCALTPTTRIEGPLTPEMQTLVSAQPMKRINAGFTGNDRYGR